MPSSFPRVLASLNELTRLTEEKIQAVIARRPADLVALLQQELDPLTTVNQHLLEIPQYPPDERRQLRTLLTRWADRGQYLADLLETQLGYVDFARTLLGKETPYSVDLGL